MEGFARTSAQPSGKTETIVAIPLENDVASASKLEGCCPLTPELASPTTTVVNDERDVRRPLEQGECEKDDQDSDAWSPDALTSMTSFQRPPSLRPLVPLCIYAILSAAGPSMVGPILPRQRREYFGSDTAAAWWGGVAEALGAGIGFFTAGLFGLACDAYGRRPALLVSALVVWYPYVFQYVLGAGNPWPFMISMNTCFLIGSTPFGSATVGMSMIADMFDKNCRLLPSAIFVVMIFVGIMFAPIPALLGLDDDSTAFAGAGVLLLAVVFVYAGVPETLPKDRRKAVSLNELRNPLVPLRYLFKNTYLFTFACLGFCFLFPFNADASIQLYFLALKLRTGFSDLDNGMLAAEMGLCLLLFMLLLLPQLSLRMTAPNVVLTAICALLFNSVAHCFVTEAWQAFLFLSPSFALAFSCLPVMSQMVSVVVPRNEQGIVNGAMSAVKGVATVTGPLGGTVLFSLGKSMQFIELPYLVNTAVCGAGVWLVQCVVKRLIQQHTTNPAAVVSPL